MMFDDVPTKELIYRYAQAKWEVVRTSVTDITITRAKQALRLLSSIHFYSVVTLVVANILIPVRTTEIYFAMANMIGGVITTIFSLSTTTIFTLPNGEVLHYMNPAGNDACNGTSPSLGLSGNCAWLTPNGNAALKCGDEIIAAPGAYSTSGYSVTRQPTSCPSTTGGIDGSGGIWEVVVNCQVAFACTMNYGGASGTAGIDIQASNWSHQGWQITTSGSNAFCYYFDAATSATSIYHDVSFINNICNNAGVGFVCGDGALNQNVPGNGPDYCFMVGNLAWNANQRSDFPSAAFVDVGPANFNSGTGTRIFFEGNFAINNQVSASSGISSDLEGMMLDTPEAHAYSGQTVFRNNIVAVSSWAGIQLTQKTYHTTTLTVIITQNTLYDNDVATPFPVFATGAINMSLDGGQPWTVKTYNNVSQTTVATAGTGTTGPVYAFLSGSVLGNMGSGIITTGGTGIENIFKGVATTCSPGTSVCDPGGPPFSIDARDGSSIGTNFYVDPQFKNAADFLANHLGQPNCTGFDNVAACMGWNVATQTVTALSVIDDLTATCTQCGGKQYATPSNACIPSDPLYPTNLKGLVYHHYNGSTIEVRKGLASVPCGL
jgi:hypothetical protein